jgi:S1-C subfamily serine protease
MDARPMYGSTLVLLILAFASPILTRAATGPELAETGDSTVLVKVFRKLDDKEVMGCGTGFVIRRSGFVITSASTVARTVRYYAGTQLRETRAPVRHITLVVNAGTDEAIELPARLLVEDPTSGLALLKVNHTFDSPLELSTSGAAQVGHEVRVVGFPMDNGCAAPWNEPAPEADSRSQVSPGQVSALRQARIPGGFMIETGIGITPGHPGAPMLNADDRLVGVVVMGADATAHAIPLPAIQDFIETCSVKVVFSPAGIDPDLDRITIDVIPMLGELDDVTGTVSVEGRDLRRTHGRFSKSETGYRAVVRTDDRLFGISPPESYNAVIQFRKPGTDFRLERRFKVPASDTQVAIDHSPDVYRLDPGPSLPGDHEGLAKYATQLKSDGTSLADAEGDSDIKRSESGSLVIDQNTLTSFVGVSSEAFSELETDEEKALATRFEIVFNEFCNLTAEHMIPIPSRQERMSNAQYRRLIVQHLDRVGQASAQAWASYLSKIAEEADDLASDLHRRSIGKCSDGKWRKAKTGCEVPTPDDCS